MHSQGTWHVCGILAAMLGGSLAQAAVISDSFEVDSSANYTVVDESNAASGDGTPDGTVDFSFDYVAAGIPLAPRSAPGDTRGLKMAVNETANDAGPVDHITAYHNLPVALSNYFIQVDMYMRVEIGAPATTEMASVGIAANTNDFNSIFTPIAGSGHFVSITGDGGSSSDYRHFLPSGTPVNSGDASYLNSDNTTNSSGDTYQTLFPGGDFPGSPGNRWTTLSITVNPSTVTYALDGTPIIRTATEASSGLVALGYADLFTSVGPHYVVFDNLFVIPEPHALLLAGSSAVCLGWGRRRRRV